MSELALKLIHEAKETRATRLDLGNCGLTELPDELFELVWLEELILSNEWYEYSNIDRNWKTVKSLNNDSENEINELSYELCKLSELRTLFLSGLLIESFKPLKGLVKLEQLYVSNTKIEDLTPLQNLKKLQVLDLAFTEITYLSPIKSLTQIKILDLNSINIGDYSPMRDIHALKNLVKLEYLNISATRISDLNPIKGLLNLRDLDVSNTQVSDLTPLKNLVNLQQIDVSDTQVSDLTPLKESFKNHKFEINYTNCPLTTPPKEIVEKGNPAIDRYFSLIIESEEFEEFIRVSTLDGREIGINRNGGVVVSFTGFTSEDKIPNYITDAWISEDGKKIFWKDKNEKTYSIEINIDLAKKTVELYEAKMIIVGEGGSGKTTLFEKMKDANHKVGNTPETHGIIIKEGLEIHHLDIGDNIFHANLWDFGGQELQYMTHQFFLTPRAFYVLMMDARKESPNLTYWFKIISLLGKDSQTSTEKVPLLLVFNKREGSTGTPQYQDRLEYYKEHLEVNYIEVDFAVNDKRWENLKETIEKTLVNLPIVKSQLPKQWKPIREALREEAVTKPYITTQRLDEICSTHRVTEERDQWQLSDYLHKLGSILHFQNDETLMDTVILSPEWAVDGVYCILKDTKIREVQFGRFTKEDIFDILLRPDKDRKWTYKKADAQKILQLMTRNNFDICYESANGQYVAAQHLPDNAPPQYKWHNHTGSLRFRYQYPIMPKGLMSRLIVRLSEYLEKIDGVEIVWKKGAVLNIHKDGKECRVLIKEDDAESQKGLRQIIIEVMGDADYRKFALQRVRDEVDELHKKWFRSIKADEMIPCCCKECIKNDNPQLYKLENLLKKQTKRPDTSCDDSGQDIMIQHLLEGVYDKNEIKAFEHKTKHERGYDREPLQINFNPVIQIDNKPTIHNTIENKGFNAQDIEALTHLLDQLNEHKKEKLIDFVETLPEPETKAEKESTGKQIIKWLDKNAEGIVGNVAASVYYDALKMLLGI